MLRLISGIATGYMIFAISAALLFQLSGVDPHAKTAVAFAVASGLWGVAFAALGGFAAVAIAQRSGLAGSIGVAALIALGAIVSMALDRHGSMWSQLSAVLLMAPAAYAGGMIQRRRKTRANAPS